MFVVARGGGGVRLIHTRGNILNFSYKPGRKFRLTGRAQLAHVLRYNNGGRGGPLSFISASMSGPGRVANPSCSKWPLLKLVHTCFLTDPPIQLNGQTLHTAFVCVCVCINR